MNRFKGFTLVELMVAIAIAAILLMIAMPSFQSIARNNAVRATTNDLISTINLARQQSLNMRTQVEISPAAGGWGNGWGITFADHAAGEDANFKPRNNVSVISSSGNSSLVFRAKGGIQGGGGIEFNIIHNDDNSITRIICTSFFGKITHEGCS